MKKGIINLLYLLVGFSLCQEQVPQTPYSTYNLFVYGSAVQAYGLNNVIPSTGSASTSMYGRVAFRFRAQHTGSITGIRMYVMSAQTGYGAGNYGIWLVS